MEIDEALTIRQAEIDFIKAIANDILENADRIDALVIGIESNNSTYVNSYGSLNTCGGLLNRLKLGIDEMILGGE